MWANLLKKMFFVSAPYKHKCACMRTHVCAHIHQTINGDFSGKGHFYYVCYESFIICVNIFFSKYRGWKENGLACKYWNQRSSLSFHTYIFNIIPKDYKDKMWWGGVGSLKSSYLKRKKQRKYQLGCTAEKGQVQVRQVITLGKLNLTSLSVPIHKMENSKFYNVTEKSELYNLAKMPSTLTHHKYSIHSSSCGVGGGGEYTAGLI